MPALCPPGSRFDGSLGAWILIYPFFAKKARENYFIL
jgi:hypothetical protein